MKGLVTINRTYLGVELGSTRIKAVTLDGTFNPVSSSSYSWVSNYVDGVWTYSMDEVWKGLKTALAGVENRDMLSAAGISGMMHGYLVFDKDWNLLVPFRTWQNTITGPAAEKLTELFGFNIPQRWSIAHLYQAILNGEEHVDKIAHINTLAGYVHYMLTGENVLGIGDASGMFPVDSETLDYDVAMAEKFDTLIADKPFTIREILPRVLSAGEPAGRLTEKGATLIDYLLPVGLPFAPAEGDMGTGMTATNAVAPRTGNISAGTSINAMIVLDKPLKELHPEIDIVSTPAGRDVAMVHCNNCTNDMNAWVSLFSEAVELFGGNVSGDELFGRLYRKSLEGESDCGGVLVYNYLAGEGITHQNEGRPMVIRRPDSKFTLANFLRAQLYSTMATLKIGMEILVGDNVKIDSLTGHGGLFKTPQVGQRYMAAACNVPIVCMDTAGEGGPYGMALLAAYTDYKDDISLEVFLSEKVFKDVKISIMFPDAENVEGFTRFIKKYKCALPVEQIATKLL